MDRSPTARVLDSFMMGDTRLSWTGGLWIGRDSRSSYLVALVSTSWSIKATMEEVKENEQEIHGFPRRDMVGRTSRSTDKGP